MVNKLKLLVFLLPLALVACNQHADAITPLSSPLPSITPIPSHTVPPTTRPTTTRLPPLPAAEAEAKLVELLKDNGGCRLPCFMGIEPGETTGEIFRSYMYQFFNISQGAIYLSGSDSEIRISFSIQFPEDPSKTIPSMEVSIKNNDPRHGNNNDYVFDDPLFVEYVQYYSLPSLLTNYGQPSEIYVGLEPGEMGSVDFLRILLDYPKLGWRVDYGMPFWRDGYTISACPSQAFVALALWEPDNSVAAQVSERWITGAFVLSIEQATDLSLEQFYQQFKDSNNPQCMETQAEVWPWYYEIIQSQPK